MILCDNTTAVSYIPKMGGIKSTGGANIFGVFRVKNHDFTPKNHIFSNCGGKRENVWGIACEKSRFYAKNYIFSNFRGGGRA
jgi:hypothetical protein